MAISEDPNHAEHYLERGNILRRQRRYDEALADYATAMRLSPPFPEIHYNRGDLRLTLGDTDGALADFSYVLELGSRLRRRLREPGLHLPGLPAISTRRTTTPWPGLARDPDNPYLHVVMGQVHAAREEFAEAKAAFDRAVAADPAMVSALSGRASLAFEMGEIGSAIADLDQALAVSPDDAALRFNRAFAYQERRPLGGRPRRSRPSPSELAPDDPETRDARELCRHQMALQA